MERPQRAHHLTLDLGADEKRELCAALRNIAMQIERGELTTGCSGGYGSGYTYAYKVDPEMTHDRYFELSNKWLAEREAEKAV